jgi:hypothetical protein
VSSSSTPLFHFTPNERRAYEAATLRYTAAADIQNYLDHAGLQAKDLAHRIRKSRAWVSKLLSGRQNATLDTLADAGWALGARWQIGLVPAERAGTPAENDPPAPEWASNTGATISVDVPAAFPFQQGSGLISLTHEPKTRLVFAVVNPTEHELRNVVIHFGFHGATIAPAQKQMGSSASASFELSGARD